MPVLPGNLVDAIGHGMAVGGVKEMFVRLLDVLGGFYMKERERALRVARGLSLLLEGGDDGALTADLLGGGDGAVGPLGAYDDDALGVG